MQSTAEAALALPVLEPPVPSHGGEEVEEPIVGEVESEGEVMEDLPSDIEENRQHANEDVGNLEDFRSFAARGYVPEGYHLPPDEPPSSLEEYKTVWAANLAKHSRVVAGDFGNNNLVPKAVPALWQDCPHVSGFDSLKSDDAISRLSVCRPHSAIEQASFTGGVGRIRAVKQLCFPSGAVFRTGRPVLIFVTPAGYAHTTGNPHFQTRAPMQLACTIPTILPNYRLML